MTSALRAERSSLCVPQTTRYVPGATRHALPSSSRRATSSDATATKSIAAPVAEMRYNSPLLLLQFKKLRTGPLAHPSAVAAVSADSSSRVTWKGVEQPHGMEREPGPLAPQADLDSHSDV